MRFRAKNSAIRELHALLRANQSARMINDLRVDVKKKCYNYDQIYQQVLLQLSWFHGLNQSVYQGVQEGLYY